MRWRELADKPAVNWTALATFVGLLADFRGAAANIAALIPVLQAFLPLIATVGVAFFGYRSVSYLMRWLWLRRPSARFGNCYAKISWCRDSVAFEMPLSFGPFPYAVHSRIQELRDSLERLGIRCPSEDPNDSNAYLLSWYNFLVNLAPLAQHGDLRTARELMSKRH